jgi:hypothetical protein
MGNSYFRAEEGLDNLRKRPLHAELQMFAFHRFRGSGPFYPQMTPFRLGYFLSVPLHPLSHADFFTRPASLDGGNANPDLPVSAGALHVILDVASATYRLMADFGNIS